MKKNIFFLIACSLLLSSCKPKTSEESTDTLEITTMDETEGGMSFYLKKYNAGIEFYAIGTEPFWSLDVIGKKSVRFTTAEGFEMNVPYAPFTNGEGHQLHFYSETEMGSIKIELHRERCEDNMSGTPFSHRVRILIETKEGGQSFEGCGRFVVSPELHNSFVLMRWNKEDISGENIAKGAPILDFDLATLRVSGHAGCNQIMSDFFVEPGEIHFNVMASTMMDCEGSMEFEQKYLTALGEGSHFYQLNNGSLALGNTSNKMIYKLVE